MKMQERSRKTGILQLSQNLSAQVVDRIRGLRVVLFPVQLGIKRYRNGARNTARTPMNTSPKNKA
ncbi:MAG: hypothetical protein DMF58_09690 [Acidobacteria bacterium]|nr:MAG: hypothetical protein DMF58_09690 [Acidobacteriota bacterium]